MKVTDMSFKEGQEFKIRILPSPECEHFSINIGHDPDNIAMHFNPRFDAHGDTETIVFNSKSGGDWGAEQRNSNFPFVRGGGMQAYWAAIPFYINMNNESFYIKLPDGSMIDFPNRLGDVKYKYFNVVGDARIIGIKIK